MHDPSPPIPIAFCITELDRGGAEKALCQLDRQAWSPRVYCLGPRGHFVEPLEAAGIPVECFNARGLLSFPRVMWQLRRSLRQFRPALLQTFLFHGNLVGRLAARLARVPIVVSGIRVADRRSRWFGRLDRWTNWLVKQNVCVSQGVADFSIQEVGLQPAKTTVIPNSVDVEPFASAEPADLALLGLRPADPVVLTVGRLEEQKGVTHLLQGAALVLQSFPSCQFLIVGDGSERRSLEAQADSLGIANSVRFVGARGDLPGLYRASSVFVLASLWEGMPNALLEAMAASLPVVATSVEGSREIVEDHRTGLLVPRANGEELAKAICVLLSDHKLATSFGFAAQCHVREYFANDRMVAAYQSLYRRLIGSA
jgi:glycosyltransferase involved in cell wall biosynthesis